jgi:hypothetical protein
MTKQEALQLIDDHKNKLVNPVTMLHWAWLRVIILQIPDEAWEQYREQAQAILAR